MTYKLTQFENEPILLVSLEADFSVRHDQPVSDAETRAILEASPTKLFNIVDLTRLRLNMDDVIAGAHNGTAHEEAVWRHPKNELVIFVSPNRMVQVAAKGLSATAFGGIETRTFNTVDEALTWVRAHIAQPA